MIAALFLILATLGVLAALGTALAREPARAASCLAAFSFLVAGQFVLLGAGFLAAVQVLIGFGGAATLRGLALAPGRPGEAPTGGRARRVGAGLASLGLLAALVVGIGREAGDRPRVRASVDAGRASARSCWAGTPCRWR